MVMKVKPGDLRSTISVWNSMRARSVSTNLFPQLAVCVTRSRVLPSSSGSVLSLVLVDASLSGITSNVFSVEFSLRSLKGTRASFQRLGRSSFLPVLRPCSTNGLYVNMQILKEAGVITKRSK